MVGNVNRRVIKGPYSQSYGFSSRHVWMWELNHWTIKKAEHPRIDAFELWCWKRLLRAPWTARRSNQSILKEINPGYSMRRTNAEAETPVLRYLMWRTDSFEKTLMVGKIDGGNEGDDRGWDDWMASLIRWTWVWGSSESWWWTGKSGVLQSMGSQRVRHNWVTELNWKSPKELW